MLVNVQLLKTNVKRYIVQPHSSYGHTLQSVMILNALILGVMHLGLFCGTIKIVVTYIVLFVVQFGKPYYNSPWDMFNHQTQERQVSQMVTESFSMLQIELRPM